MGCSQIRPIITITRTEIIPTETQLPTQSPLQETIMIQRLLSPQCVLPCYLGIIPGITSIIDAKSKMDDIGAIYRRTNQIGLQDYFYFLHLGDLSPKN
jgi:hypothetical protein